jgi:hypothetical protein
MRAVRPVDVVVDPPVLCGQRARWGDPRPKVGNYQNAGEGNYLNALHIYWGIT